MNQDVDSDQDICPLLRMIQSSPVVGKGEEPRQSVVVRAKLFLKRRLGVKDQKKIKGMIGSALDLFSGRRRKEAADITPDTRPAARLEAGDIVRIRSREQITATLDRWRSLKGCGFLEEMAAHCGTTQKVMKRVERFIDERDYRAKKASGVVLLEGLMCSGGGRCDRACFFFWREEWLEKLDKDSP